MSKILVTDDDGCGVWIGLDDDSDPSAPGELGFLIGIGATREEAVQAAVADLGAAIEQLTQPAPPRAGPRMKVHLYTAPAQPATVFLDRVSGQTRKFRNPQNRLLFTSCCRMRRPAKNLLVQVYYDEVRYFCRPGKGCRIPAQRHRDVCRVCKGRG